MGTTFIIKCEECGTKNRVPGDKTGLKPVCGSCKTPLPGDRLYDRPINVTDMTFQDDVLNYKGPVLLDCWAPWCGPCKVVGPLLDSLAKEYAGQIKIAKLNVDENQTTASRYSVMSIPTMILFKNGEAIESLVGAQPRNQIENLIKRVI
jgi:thioredoxin 2